MRDPRVWAAVAEDGVRPEQFQHQPGATYFELHGAGFVMFRRITVGMQEIHVAMLKGARGVEAFVRACLAEMRARGARKFLAPIGDWNLAALRLARRCGFQEEGRIAAAYRRGGVPRDMIMMGGS